MGKKICPYEPSWRNEEIERIKNRMRIEIDRDIMFSSLDSTRQSSPMPTDEDKDKNEIKMLKEKVKFLEVKVKLLEEKDSSSQDQKENFNSLELKVKLLETAVETLEEKMTSFQNEKESTIASDAEDEDRYAVDFPDISTKQLIFSGWRSKKRSKTGNK